MQNIECDRQRKDIFIERIRIGSENKGELPRKEGFIYGMKTVIVKVEQHEMGFVPCDLMLRFLHEFDILFIFFAAILAPSFRRR